jgi:hypothetical protein
MRFPLTFRFKRIALAPQVYVRDADDQLQLYVKQKLMKLKEAVNVFGDEAQTRLLYTIGADRVLESRARYTIHDAAGVEVGALQAMGLRSLWKLHYQIAGPGGAVLFDVREDNPWVKVVDSLFGEIPVLGLFSGYLFNPKYNVTRPDGSLALRLVKIPSLGGRRFQVERVAELAADEEGAAVLSLLMMVLLQGERG